MLSNFIKMGDKIDLQVIDRSAGGQAENQKTYASSIYEIVSEDMLEIMMPVEKGKLILLPVDSEYNLVFYGEGGLYQCFARIVDRYKSSNVYILVVELTSNLRKYQRREYYRFSCALDMCARNLQEEELDSLDEIAPYDLTPGLPLKQSVIVDISGGGLRFLSSQMYEAGSMLYICYDLLIGDENRKYEVIGKVLSVKKLENRTGTWEHRVQYYNMNKKVREEIIKYIFEEERKSRRKERFS